MQNLRTSTEKLMLSNRRHAGEFQYTVPSPTTYPYQWLWDSCFHAVILTHFNIEDAKKEILSLVSKQLDDGMIPHMIYWEKHKAIDIDWGRKGTSSITQPPIIAYSVWRIYEKDKDKSFVEEVYDSLVSFYRYVISRDPRGNHLAGIINPDESGEDNSPRFDIPLELPPIHKPSENSKRRLDLVKKNRECDFDANNCAKNFFWVKDVPFNAFLIQNMEIMAKIATLLGREEDVYFDRQVEYYKDAMNKFMYEDGIYWTTCGEDYLKIKTKTSAIFAPLFAGIPSQEDAKRIVEEHLQNEGEFKTKYMVPTVARDEPSFDPNNMWRGPVWIGVNWFLYHGLKNYGYGEIAERIKADSYELLEKNGFREYFNPLTGSGSGAADFTWGGLVIDME